MKLTSAFLSFTILFFSANSVFSQSEREDMDKALQQELTGGAEQTSSSSETEKPKASDPAEDEQDLIRQRYTTSEDSVSLTGLLLRVLLALLIMGAAFFFILRFLNKNRDSQMPVKGVMNVLSSLSLGQGKQLQIVDISGQLFVLGLSEQSVNLITEIQSTDTKNKIYQMKESFEPTNDSFLVSLMSSFKDMHEKMNQSPLNPRSGESALSELKKRQRKKLEELKKDRMEFHGEDLS